MAKILIVKTSSLGDVVHMLPAVTDAARKHPSLVIDWVVEENFAEVPAWHPAVRQVIPVALRRWRKQFFSRDTRREYAALREHLHATEYDYVIDSQGLIKSAWISRLAQGERHGYDWRSIREPLASLFYQHRFNVSRERHAITRNRLLMAHVLDYSIEATPMDYGLADAHFTTPALGLKGPYLVALHGTSRADKEWPEANWRYLLKKLCAHGVATLLPWGNAREQERAERLAQVHADIQVLPQCKLSELAGILQNARGVIGMDTGLMHIAAALNKSGIGLYPVTVPRLTGLQTGGESRARMETISGAATRDAEHVSDMLLGITGIAPKK